MVDCHVLKSNKLYTYVHFRRVFSNNKFILQQEEAEKCLAEATEILLEDYRAPLVIKLHLEDTTHKIFKP